MQGVFTDGMWLQIAIYCVSFGTSMGVIITKLKTLETKQDKHNNLIERMTRVEGSIKAAHHRIDEIKEKQ